MNTILLKKVAKAIKEHPGQVTMDGWKSGFTGVGDYAKGCGTAGCIAAWIVATAKESKLAELHSYTIPDQAQEMAGITGRQTEKLFYTDGWPDKYREELRGAESDRAYAQVVAKRLTEFIKTKGKV